MDGTLLKSYLYKLTVIFSALYLLVDFLSLCDRSDPWREFPESLLERLLEL
jgi:hypothetical protein